MSYRLKSQSIHLEKYKELHKKNGSKLRLIDVRNQLEYETARIPGAISIPLGDLMKYHHDLKKSELCVIYSQAGNRSQIAADWLAGEGYTKVLNLEGGMNAWDGYKAQGHFELNLNLLPPEASFFEAIQMAVAMEENLKLFYIDLAEFCHDETVMKVLVTLTKFEDQHKKHLISQYDIEDENQLRLDEFNQRHGRRLEGGGELDGTKKFFSKMINNPEDVLKVGMAIEAQALDFYSRLSQKSFDQKCKQLFDEMMHEELVHLDYISKELDKYMAIQNLT